MDRKSALLAQVFMTFMMAAAMSGIMGLVAIGPSIEWLTAWPRQFLVAWPVAFALTMVAWPAAMRLSRAVTRPRADGAAAEQV